MTHTFQPPKFFPTQDQYFCIPLLMLKFLAIAHSLTQTKMNSGELYSFCLYEILNIEFRSIGNKVCTCNIIHTCHQSNVFFQWKTVKITLPSPPPPGGGSSKSNIFLTFCNLNRNSMKSKKSKKIRKIKFFEIFFW